MTYLRGIDISAWQGRTPGLTGLDFAWARATYGMARDARFLAHTQAFRQAGLVVGAYAFGVNGPGAEQAGALLDFAGGADLFALDLESDGDRPRMTDAQAETFIATVKATGRTIGLYHSDSGFSDLGQDYNWVAKWGTVPPAREWTFWQHRGNPLDLDYFNGDRAALLALADRTTQEAAVPIYERVSRSGKFTVAGGTTPRGWSPRGDGQGWLPVKTWVAKSAPSVGTFDYLIRRIAGTTTPASLLHAVGGYFDGLFVSTAEVEEEFDPVEDTGSVMAELESARKKIAAAAAALA